MIHSHGTITHDHPGSEDRTHIHEPEPAIVRIFDVYVMLLKALMIVAAIVVGFFIVRWALTEYYIATHCTTVLGTRVCK